MDKVLGIVVNILNIISHSWDLFNYLASIHSLLICLKSSLCIPDRRLKKNSPYCMFSSNSPINPAPYAAALLDLKKGSFNFSVDKMIF